MPTPDTQPTHPEEAGIEANKRLVHRHMLESWSQGKLDTASDLLADDVHLHDPVFPTLPPGVRHVRNHIQACRLAFPDLKFTIDDTIAERNEVVVHWTATGTHQGDFLGMHPTGRPATVTGTTIYRIEGARIVEEWAHWNLMTMIEQLGASPEHAASRPHTSPNLPS